MSKGVVASIIEQHSQAFLAKAKTAAAAAQASGTSQYKIPKWARDGKFPSHTSYEKFTTELSPKQQKEYADSAHLTITEEELELAKKYIALVMITGGQHQKDGISQAEIYTKAEIGPDVTAFADEISAVNLDSEDGKESFKKLISKVAEKVSPQNVKKLYQRLYSKRPLTFWGSSDQSLSKDLKLETRTLHSETDLAENICYSEIELAALMQVSSRTIFINNGYKYNKGELGKKGTYIEEGISAGLVGARFEIDDGMEAHHLRGKKLEKSLAGFKADEKGLGDLGRIKRVNKNFAAGYGEIWREFYRTPEKEAEFEKYDEGKIDEEGLTKRLYLTYKKFIYDNIAQAQKLGKKAYIRLSGLGDGVWADDDIKATVKLCIGQAIAKVYAELSPEMAEDIAAFELCEFVPPKPEEPGAGASEDERIKYRDALRRHNTAIEIYNKGNYATGFESYLQQAAGKPLHLVPVINSSNTNYVETASPFTTKAVAQTRVIAGNLDSFGNSGQYLGCVMYAYDGNSYPGNEYWEGALTASIDPAHTCATGNAFLQNAQTNPELLERLEVVQKNGKIVQIDVYQEQASAAKPQAVGKDKAAQPGAQPAPPSPAQARAKELILRFFNEEEVNIRDTNGGIEVDFKGRKISKNNLAKIGLNFKGDQDDQLSKFTITDTYLETFIGAAEKLTANNKLFELSGLATQPTLSSHFEYIDQKYDFNHFITFNDLEDAKIFRDFLFENGIKSGTGQAKSITIEYFDEQSKKQLSFYLNYEGRYTNNKKEYAFNPKPGTDVRATLIFSDEQFREFQAKQKDFAAFYQQAKAQAEFQNALACIAQGANPRQRAVLRDRLATTVCPPHILQSLQRGHTQLDTTEFLNFLLDAVMPQEKRIDVTSTVSLKDGRPTSETTEKHTKLELSFATGGDSATITEMLRSYERPDNLTGVNQYNDNGNFVDASKTLKPQITNPDAELVVSLNRFEYEVKGKDLVRRKIDKPVTLDTVTLPVGAEQRKYLPTAFIVHLGTMGGGHYVAYVKEQIGNNQIWVEYNDSERNELGSELPEAAKNAYVVKYSPVDAKGQCRLPQSQVYGTHNGGMRCWANAAFAFAMSMVSLNEHQQAYVMPPDQSQSVDVASDNEFIGKIIDLDKQLSAESKADKLAFLKEVTALLATKEANELYAIGDIMESMQLISPARLLGQAVEIYFNDICTDENTYALFELYEFFSDPSNAKLSLNIIEEIQKNIEGFKSNPNNFVIEFFPNTKPTQQDKRTSQKPKTLIELCIEALKEGEVDTFKKYLEIIKTDPKAKEILHQLILPLQKSGKQEIAKLIIKETFSEAQQAELRQAALREKKERAAEAAAKKARNGVYPLETIKEEEDDDDEAANKEQIRQALLRKQQAEAEAARKKKEEEEARKAQDEKRKKEEIAKAAAEAARKRQQEEAAAAAKLAEAQRLQQLAIEEELRLRQEEEAKKGWKVSNQHKLEIPKSTSPRSPSAIAITSDNFISIKATESSIFNDTLRGNSMRLANGLPTNKKELIKILAAVVITSISETLLEEAEITFDGYDKMSLSAKEIKQAMDYAKLHGGFSSTVTKIPGSDKTVYTENQDVYATFELDFWRKISGRIQQKNLELGILTGRLEEDKPDGSVIVPVGLRSVFVFDILSDPEALEILNARKGISISDLLSENSAYNAKGAVMTEREIIKTAAKAVADANHATRHRANHFK